MSVQYKDAKMSSYWNKKPVMKLEEQYYKTEQIKVLKKKDELTVLPDGYSFYKIELTNDIDMLSVSEFLTKYYRRGTNSTYITKFDTDLLRWEMNNNGFFLVIKHLVDGHIIGLIGQTKRHFQLYDKTYDSTEQMYLCVNTDFRSQQVSKALIEELIRTTNNDNSIFSNNRIVCRPLSCLRQFSRPINYMKLKENDFIQIQSVDDEFAHKKTKIVLKPNPKYVIAENNEENIKTVYDLYRKSMETFSMHVVLDVKGVENYFFNNKYVRTLLIRDDNDNVVDFVSYRYYDIVNTNKQDNNIIKAANVLMYSSITINTDIIIMNLLKQVAHDKIDILYLDDMMYSSDVILNGEKSVEEDSDNEVGNYDMNMIKTGKKYFITLFNIKCETMKQNMVSWLNFN